MVKVYCMDGCIGIICLARDISAVAYGLRQKFSKDSLYLENFCLKALATFAGKSLIVPNI